MHKLLALTRTILSSVGSMQLACPWKQNRERAIMAIGPRAHALQAPGVTPVTTDSEAANIGDVDPDETVTRTKSELETMTARDEGMTKAEDLQAGETTIMRDSQATTVGAATSSRDDCPHEVGVAGQGPQEAHQS